MAQRASATGASSLTAKTALFDEFARLGQALANGRRLEILDVLANGERTVERLATETGMSIANASQHLQVLREVGLVLRRREGTHICYALHDPQVFDLWRNLRTVAVQRRAEVGQLADAYLGARHTLEEFHDTPVLDKGFFVLVGNNLLLYRLLQEGRREELRHALAWWLKVTKAYAPKLVNPGGDEMWKGQRNANITSLDDKIGSFDLTPRRVIAAFIEAGNELGLPHPVHIHCNNLGHSGNVETTLETMRLAEGRRAHIAHIQFHSYGAAAGKSQSNPTSRARDIIEYINTHPNISADVGAVMFGPATIMTGDAPLAYMLRRFGGNKWVNADTENESGCGIVPFRYQDRVYTNALQWAIGLELLLLSEDPWRMVFSTDHPNGGSFMSYPRLIRLLMDRGYRKEQMAHVNQKALDRSALRDCQEREYSLSEIAIITRAGPARLLGLTDKGHLGVGADADVTIYEEDEDKEKMFSAPRYVIKDGELIIEDHELRADHQGRLLHVAPDYDPQIEQVIEPFFEDFYTIRFANYPVDDRYVPNGQIIPTTPSVAAGPATAGTRP